MSFKFTGVFFLLVITGVISFQYSTNGLCIICDHKNVEAQVRAIAEVVDADESAVFPTLHEAIAAQIENRRPVKMIKTGNADYPEFPSYSFCEKSFFRMAVVPIEVNKIITAEGWKSGWVRRQEELERKGQQIKNSAFSGLPPEYPFKDRIIEYVRVKGDPSPFPKHSTIVGIHDNPIRNLSVGYHTGYDSGAQGNPMRMDEVEIGPCAQRPECKNIALENTTEVFTERNLTPRYSVEGEWAAEGYIPAACVVATYRIKFQKIDKECYSDTNKNCNF